MLPPRWSVYHGYVEIARKNKYYIVVQRCRKYNHVYIALINTKYHKFNCPLKIDPRDVKPANVLAYPSWVSCSSVSGYLASLAESYIHNNGHTYKGRLEARFIKKLKNKLENCETLAEKHKRLLLERDPDC